MRNRSTLCSSIRLMLLTALISCQFLAAWAQGNSIPTTTAVRENIESVIADELPEGVTYRYPLFNGLSVSVNAFSPVMQIFGNGHANYEGMLTVDLHHRFFPQVVAGVGYCNETNDDGVHYECDMMPYMKVGMAYNTKYNDVKPNDFYAVFARLGYSHGKAKVSHLYYTDGYWPEQGPLQLTGIEGNSVWLELGAMIKVQVINHISLGWDLSWSPFIVKGNSKHGKPYYVPGYGTTTTQLSFAFNVYYDIF